LDLAVIPDPMLDPLFFRLESCMAHVFFKRQHDFIGGERAKREGGKTPLSELLTGPLWH